MNKSPILTAIVSLAAVITVAPLCLAQTNSPAGSRNVKTTFLHNDGFSVGQDLNQDIPTLTLDDDDAKAAPGSFPEHSKEDVASMTEEHLMEWMQSFIDTMKQQDEEAATSARNQGKSYRAEFAKKEGVTSTKSGLMYRVLTKGEGRTYDRARDGEEAIVSVTYEGKKIDGTTFDMAKAPIRMGINQAVPGFIEALKTMPIGSEWEICLPPHLAYGEQAPAPIGANATLVFTLKLHDIITLAPPRPYSTPMHRTPARLQQHQAQDREDADRNTGTE